MRGTVEEKRLPLSPYPVRVPQHAVVWSTVVAFFAFVFENSGIRTVFAGAIQTSLVFMIIMLSLVVLTGYTGQISLAQMSLAGVAAFFMARMMADGTVQGVDLSAGLRTRACRGRSAALAGIAVAVVVGLVLGLAGGAHPRRAAGRRHDRRGDHPPGRLPRERQADRPRLRRRRRRSCRPASSGSTSAPAASGAERQPGVRHLRGGRARGPGRRRGQHPALRARPPVPLGAGQRAGRGRGRDQRRPHQAAGLRHQRGDRRHRRRDARLQAGRGVVGQLPLHGEPGRAGLRLPRRHHIDQRRHRRRAARRRRASPP